ncbi:hypothetical protein SAMN04488498_102220 [Mesorhizobium albiziae]|jgi:hypothetical protein|uniref:Uncharacterized protein n=1 Tax=Neomesorhizobium albiziae TaxID=335020 RepID=A0A1I3WK30_9HYPH|nr:hypothetical protein [Mesorhizobium albiziae]GLS31620.1 hypothetical protein GCM10007937_33300 [Mesorhizobium albiziae]SFK06831.1 hypothetical protein SAMN04488498_102220 [Mesorhizobium albiziae]
MTTRRTATPGFFEIVGSAIAAAAAANNGRSPRNRDLRVLGIDPAQYHSIRRF